MPKTLTGTKRAEFYQMIVKSTATIFASMINPKFRGANWKFTPENITRLTWTGFFAQGYDENDLIQEYPDFPETITLKECWEKESLEYARQLIEHAGLDNEEKGFKVVVSGFNTQAEADTFIGWYEGQGEQDSCIWVECRKEEGIINSRSMMTDMQKYHEVSKWQGNQRELPLKMRY